MKYYLSIASLVNNEGLWLKEWIEYHLSKGIEHFYLYDTGSTDDTKEVLKPYGELITYKEFKLPLPYQMTVLNELRKDSKSFWTAFVDPDEFLVCEGKLPDLLKEYEEFGGIGVNWAVYGSNGHDRRPIGGVLENYTRRGELSNPVNTHIKTICQVDKIETIEHPHFFKYKEPYFCVTENKELIDSPFSAYHSSDRIRINHYFCKSKEDYEQKIRRGRCDVPEDEYDWAKFNAHDLNEVEERF